ncbi:MAG: TolC family protein [Gracilimonas sp.]|uniref:TolC family protein n=1 Tax=Gracilimonas sp. TaxID=1974203 RepID=UPI003753D1B8|nr:TolC family protein [Gracilimonas sp.]
MKRLFILGIMIFWCDLSFAQQSFSLNEALDAALLNNYDIQISEIDAEKAANSATRGNAGQLPTLGIISSMHWAYNDIELRPGSFFQNLINPGSGAQSPSSISYDGVYSTQLQVGIGTEFVIFDGMKGHYRYKMLKTGQDMAGLNYRARMEQTILNVTQRYVKVASFQKALELKEAALQQSADRFTIVDNRKEFGQVNEQQYLQALADLKTDSTDFKELQLSYRTAYRDLHLEIGWDKSDYIPVEEEFSLNFEANYQELSESLVKNNTLLAVREQKIKQVELEEKVIKGNLYPTLKANAQYGYAYQTATDGQFETQEQLGVTGGLTLRIPIFSGGRTKSALQNAKASIKQDRLLADQTKHQLQVTFDNTWEQYQFHKQQLSVQRSNLKTYERNYERAKDSFKMGLITGVELRSAQLSLYNARLKVSETLYKLKLTETTLLYLSGKIFFEN